RRRRQLDGTGRADRGHYGARREVVPRGVLDSCCQTTAGQDSLPRCTPAANSSADRDLDRPAPAAARTQQLVHQQALQAIAHANAREHPFDWASDPLSHTASIPLHYWHRGAPTVSETTR